MTTQISYLGWWLLLLLCLHGSNAVFCDPLKWEYFRSQVGDCGHCEPCVRGEEKKTPEEFDVRMQKNGARLCLPCRTCKKGTYSDTHSHKCSHCTNCEALHMVEIRPCSHLKNTVCGRLNVSVDIRVHKTPDRNARQPRVPPIFENDIHTEAKEHRYESEYHGHYLALGLGLIFLITVLVIALVAGFLVRSYCIRRYNRRRVEETNRGNHREIEIQPFLPTRNDAPAFNGQSPDQLFVDDTERNITMSSGTTASYNTRSHRLLGDLEEEACHIDNEIATSKRRIRKKVKDTDEKTQLLHSNGHKKRRCRIDRYLVNYGASTEDQLFSDGEEDETGCVAEDSKSERGVALIKPLQRQHSVPVTNVERDCSPNMTLDNPDGPASVNFNIYLSQVTACNDLYEETARDVGIKEDTIGIIYKDYILKGIQEVAYQVAQKIAEKMIPKREIYKSLQKRNKAHEVPILKLREIQAIHLRGRDLVRKLN